jgi:uncharacterized ion transporter superfamily protein YfcC
MSSVQELLRPAVDTAPRIVPRRDLMPHPVVMMILIIAAAMLLSWLIPSGQFDRAPNGHVIAGSFHEIPKEFSCRRCSGHSTAPARRPILRR